MILNYHFCRNKHFTIKYDLTLSSANIFPKTNTIYSREIASTKGKDNFYNTERLAKHSTLLGYPNLVMAP